MSKRLLVIGAHSADFVWRASGTIATATSKGGMATVIALSYGERGESGVLWKEPNQTVENVKRIRHEQAAEAAGIVGAEFRCLDLGDYPLTITDSANHSSRGCELNAPTAATAAMPFKVCVPAQPTLHPLPESTGP